MTHDEDTLLEHLLAQWLAAAESGRPVSIETLCREHPDLEPALRELIALDASVHEEPDGTLVGKTLAGRYRVTGHLGAGGMGLVYAAVDAKLGRVVAVKILEDIFVRDPARVERFRREAASLAKLQNPHIVAVHDVDFESSPPFLVMDRIDGRDLRAMLDERLKPDCVARLAVEMCDALAAAHDAGIVHRDVKPTNFMVDSDGHVHLLDFGLARHLDDPGLTQSGTAVGTPLYMAPEQIRGSGVGPHSDVYALGATLYECLCRVPPFSGQGRELETRILYEDPAPPSAHHPPVPRDLEAICLRALAKDPAKRYASAAAMRADLERFLAFEPVEAQARALPAPLRRAVYAWRRHRPPLPVLIASILALALVVWWTSAGIGESIADADATRRARIRALVPTLPPTAGLWGTRAERLAHPGRAALVAKLDELVGLDSELAEARFLRMVLAEDAGRAVHADGFKRLHAAFTKLRDKAGASARAVVAALEDADATEPLVARILLPALIETGQARRTSDIAGRVARAHGETALTLWARGVAHIMRGRFDAEALGYLERANRLSPRNPTVLLSLSRVLRKLGRPGAADPLISDAVSLATHANYWHERALVSARLRRFDDAEAAIAKLPKGDARRPFELAKFDVWRFATTRDPELLADARRRLDTLLLEPALSARMRRAATASRAAIDGLERSAPSMSNFDRLGAEPLNEIALLNIALAQIGSSDARTRVEARLKLRQVLALDPSLVVAARSLAASYEAEDPVAGLQVLRTWLDPEAKTEADAALIGRLMRAIRQPQLRRSWRRRMQSAGLID